MATEMTGVVAPAESNTLRSEEERLRGMLEERLGIRTRFTSLPGSRVR